MDRADVTAWAVASTLTLRIDGEAGRAQDHRHHHIQRQEGQPQVYRRVARVQRPRERWAMFNPNASTQHRLIQGRY